MHLARDQVMVIRKQFKYMVNDGLAPNLSASILNNGIIQLNLNKCEHWWVLRRMLGGE